MNKFDWIWESPKLNELSEANFIRFVTTIYKLISENNHPKFDVILVGGNSGIVMGEYTRMIFEYLEIDPPPIIPLAFVRSRDEKFDEVENINKKPLQDFKEIIGSHKITNLKVALFVDDEIGAGDTAEACVKSYLSITGESLEKYYIVAEDHGFDPQFEIPDLKIVFLPFSKKIGGLNNILMYITPYEIEKKIKEVFDDLPDKYIQCLLLDLPTRDKKRPEKGFSNFFNEQAEKKIPDLASLRQEFRKFIMDLISVAIQEYRENKIDLSDFSYVNKILNEK